MGHLTDFVMEVMTPPWLFTFVNNFVGVWRNVNQSAREASATACRAKASFVFGESVYFGALSANYPLSLITAL